MISDTKDSMRLVMLLLKTVNRAATPASKRKAYAGGFVGSALFWVVVALGISGIGGAGEYYQTRAYAPPIQPVTMITPVIRPFSGLFQHWTLTPQQRAFIDALSDEVSPK